MFPEEHHGRISVLKYLSDIKVFWKGMSLDLDAFIHGCPECVCKSPLHSSTLVQIPSKSAVLTAQEREEEDPHLSEVKHKMTLWALENGDLNLPGILSFCFSINHPKISVLFLLVVGVGSLAFFRWLKGLWCIVSYTCTWNIRGFFVFVFNTPHYWAY